MRQLIKKESFQSSLAVLSIFWRKVIPIFFFKHVEKRERFIGKLINLITLNHFYADYYITASNTMGGIFRGINPKVRISDYQHGIIPSTQSGFFNDGQIEDRIKSNNKDLK